MVYDIPKSIEIRGVSYAIRSDYRAILDIIIALSDAELSDQERGYVVLNIFYPELHKMPPEDYMEAIRQCFIFINGGEEDTDGKKSPRLVDWEKDFPRIVAPVNRILGQEIRSAPYLHWWTFLGAYSEVGDCLFAQIVNIRNKKARGKKLDKSEQEFYRGNRKIIDIATKYTEAENETIDKWIGIKPS